MSMDVIGREPGSQQGKDFSADAWWWRPLAAYCCHVAPDITVACQHWQTNDGDGLDVLGAGSLANVLQAEIDSGRAARYRQLRNSEIEMLPNEPCGQCASTGIRLPVPHVGAGDPNNGGLKCANCGGSGYRRPWVTLYDFDVAYVQKFVEFLRACGGFVIW
jgi:hypothetical protein